MTVEPNIAQLDRAARWATAKVAAGVQTLSGNRCAEGFGILMYHRVVEHFADADAPTWNVAPAQLRQQLAGLLARGFEARPLATLIKAHHESRRIPGHVFAVTFDDGYESNYLNAWPILRELNVPATIFLATKYLDSERPFPFDDWSAAGSPGVPASSWRPLSTVQCREMLAGGFIELGAHTHSHERFLSRCAEFGRDLNLCLEVLRDRFGVCQPTFSFPFGDTSAELIDAARLGGVACCLTSRQERVRSGDDPFHWGRFIVESADTAAVLAAKLSGWYTTIATPGKMLKRAFESLASRAPDRRRISGATSARGESPPNWEAVSHS